jgi:hypothetical protein
MFQKQTPMPIFLVLVVLAGCTASAQSTGTPAGAVPPMRQIYVQDQRDRGVSLADDGSALPPAASNKGKAAMSWEEIGKRDAERREQTHKLMSEGRLITAQDFHDAAYVFQHGQEPNDYLLAHVLAVEAVVKGDETSKWISAATLDRYLEAIGKPQVFGTQYSGRDFLFFMLHKNDPEAIKNHKSEPGTTLQPYDDSLIPDPVRLDFCVPVRAKQEENLKVFNDGKYPEHMMPPGCTR